MKRNRHFILLGLLTAVALLLVVLVVGYNRETALAQDSETRQGPPSILAATGACRLGSEVSVLYVIDAEKKQLAVYSAFGGREIQFVAARKIFYDFELMSANDNTPRVFSVQNLKRQYEAYKKKKEGESKRPPRRR